MAPDYINLALEMDYKTEKISLFLSPAMEKFTFGTDDDLSVADAFGIDKGMKSRSELAHL